MQSIATIIVLVAFAQASGNEQATNAIADSQDSMNGFIDKFADKMIDRVLTEFPQVDMDDSTLGKPGQLSLPAGHARPGAAVAMRPGLMASAPPRLTVFQGPGLLSRPQVPGDLVVVYANTKGSKARIVRNERERLYNSAIKSRFRTIGRKVLAMHAKNGGPTPEMETVAREYEKLVDQAQSKGVIHKNKAARLKSTMARYRNVTDTVPAV